jgi:alcohol dehydrogenase
MKAAQISAYGHADAVNVVEVEKPKLASGQVLVEVHASSLNPFDTSVREGYLKEMVPLKLPVTLGADIAGIVVEVGEDVTNFSIGDKVYGAANVVSGNSGALAQYAAVAAGSIALAPSNISPDQAAVLPIAGISALQALSEGMKLRVGQKLFIHGGTGGIGTVAIQIAKYLGAFVATSTRGRGVELAKSLGADVVVDTSTQDFTKVLHDYDAVLDTVGGEDFVKTFDVLKRGGVAVTLAARGFEEVAAAKGITATSQMTGATTARLDAMRTLVEAGAVKPQIGHTFGLDQAREAFEARESGKFKGKIVIEITK